ncbi:MAG: M48 family metalloprotease [Neisseriaceae bacterium]
MIYIALNTLFNGVILGFLIQIGSIIINKPLNNIEGILIGYTISAILTISGYSKLAGNIMSIFITGRKPIGREISRIEPLLQEIIDSINKNYSTNYKYQDFKIRVTDNKIASIFALGYNTIIISSGSLDTLNDGQLKALLAHEVAHLYYRDSVHSMALIFGSLGTRIIMWIYSLVVLLRSISLSLTNTLKSKTIISLLSFLPILLLLAIVIINWILTKAFHLLYMALSRKAEYRADAFVAALGYKNEIIEALDALRYVSIDDNSFMGKLLSGHPAIMSRIGALEDEEAQKQYYVVFQSGIVVINSVISTDSKKELLILTGYLIFVGISLLIL